MQFTRVSGRNGAQRKKNTFRQNCVANMVSDLFKNALLAVNMGGFN